MAALLLSAPASTDACHQRWSACPGDHPRNQAATLLLATRHLPPSNHLPFLCRNTSPHTKLINSPHFPSTFISKSVSRAAISSCHGKNTSPPAAATVSGSDQGTHLHHSSLHDLLSDRRLRQKPCLPPLLIIGLAIPLVAGAIDSFLNNPSNSWYKTLRKGRWSPPLWIFALAWGVLYAVMGFA